VACRELKQCSPTSPDQPALLGGEKGGENSKSKNAMSRAPCARLVLVETKCGRIAPTLRFWGFVLDFDFVPLLDR
jgi:hypothetical protein